MILLSYPKTNGVGVCISMNSSGTIISYENKGELLSQTGSKCCLNVRLPNLLQVDEEAGTV